MEIATKPCKTLFLDFAFKPSAVNSSGAEPTVFVGSSLFKVRLNFHLTLSKRDSRKKSYTCFIVVLILIRRQISRYTFKLITKPIHKFRHFLAFYSERGKLVAELTELVGSLLFKSFLNSNLILAGFQYNLVKLYLHLHSYLL